MVRPVSNPPNPWSRTAVEYFEEVPRSIVSGNDSPDVPFRWSLNPPPRLRPRLRRRPARQGSLFGE